MNNIVTACLVIVGLINVLPLAGIMSADKLSQVYEISLNSNDIVIFMRHRALLFGLIGGYILTSAFIPKLQDSAMIMALFSMSGFIALALLEGDYNAAVSKLMIVDTVGLVVLGIAFWLKE